MQTPSKTCKCKERMQHFIECTQAKSAEKVKESLERKQMYARTEKYDFNEDMLQNFQEKLTLAVAYSSSHNPPSPGNDNEESFALTDMIINRHKQEVVNHDRVIKHEVPSANDLPFSAQIFNLPRVSLMDCSKQVAVAARLYEPTQITDAIMRKHMLTRFGDDFNDKPFPMTSHTVNFDLLENMLPEQMGSDCEAILTMPFNPDTFRSEMYSYESQPLAMLKQTHFATTKAMPMKKFKHWDNELIPEAPMGAFWTSGTPVDGGYRFRLSLTGEDQYQGLEFLRAELHADDTMMDCMVDPDIWQPLPADVVERDETTPAQEAVWERRPFRRLHAEGTLVRRRRARLGRYFEWRRQRRLAKWYTGEKYGERTRPPSLVAQWTTQDAFFERGDMVVATTPEEAEVKRDSRRASELMVLAEMSAEGEKLTAWASPDKNACDEKWEAFALPDKSALPRKLIKHFSKYTEEGHYRPLKGPNLTVFGKTIMAH
mmetsp:Transcript_10250/g.19839  ORF Transcript_10250/g.19839 Transcript_10250/m.19839 type:complete len:486 (+) Transcript_10250:69-1526(+)